jgi:demethylmenaquinone methyltransferase / 2-methoxy-6-polyprenyl-1,4-benzoquinol methylase
LIKKYRAAPDDTEHHPNVIEMFDRVSTRYDTLNRIMTLGLDVLWRRRAVRTLNADLFPRVLDVCTGTGDIALALSKRGHSTTALDASPEMLKLAKQRVGAENIVWMEGDAVHLPFTDAKFDAVTISFGIRNIADRIGALEEFGRVVRSDGCLVVLEALPPDRGLWRFMMQSYQRMIFPLAGLILGANRGAYQYLAESIAGFGSAIEFEEELAKAGWCEITTKRLIGGGVVLFTARRGALHHTA